MQPQQDHRHPKTADNIWTYEMAKPKAEMNMNNRQNHQSKCKNDKTVFNLILKKLSCLLVKNSDAYET